MFLDKNKLDSIAKAIIIINDFSEKMDMGKYIFTKEELSELLDVYKIIELNSDLNEYIKEIEEARDVVDAMKSIKRNKKDLMKYLFFDSDMNDSFMNLTKGVALDINICKGDLLEHDNEIRVIIKESQYHSYEKVKFNLEKNNIILKSSKVLIIFENSDIIEFEAKENSDFFKDKIVRVLKNYTGGIEDGRNFDS